MDKPRITADDLAKKLVNSRKLMTKVDNGHYHKGAINKDILLNDPENILKENMPMTGNQPVMKDPTRPMGPMNESTINNSKLPDNIKQAMINNPIEQISLNDTLDIDLVAKAKKLMENDGVGTKKSAQSAQPAQPARLIDLPQTQNLNTSDLERSLSPIIENIVRKTINEVLDKKLEQILMAQNATTLNENLAIKVGDTIFTGKITKSKSTK